MQNKNNKLAKENSNLKSMLKQRMALQEELLRKNIKHEYNQILTYKQMLLVIDESIQALEEALQNCKAIRETVLSNRKFLDDTHNRLYESKKEIKELESQIYSKKREESDEQQEDKQQSRKDKQHEELTIGKTKKEHQQEKNTGSNLTEKDINSYNKKNTEKKAERGVSEELFSSWEKHEMANK